MALPAVIDQDLRPRVGENRRADSEGFERQERQALVRRGHDDDGGGGQGVQTLFVRQHAGESHTGIVG